MHISSYISYLKEKECFLSNMYKTLPFNNYYFIYVSNIEKLKTTDWSNDS